MEKEFLKNEVGTYLNSGVGFDDSAKILLKHSLVKAVQVLGDNLVLFQLLGILLKGLQYTQIKITTKIFI